MTNPHRYKWHAATAQEALNILEATKELIEARLKVIAPNETFPSGELKRSTPIGLTIILDEAAAVLAANEVNALNHATRSTAQFDA